jgi:hypothetical protein
MARFLGSMSMESLPNLTSAENTIDRGAHEPIAERKACVQATF